LSQEDAARALEDAGFRVATVDRDVTDPTQDGTVVDQRPPPGSERPPGSEVTIAIGRLAEETTPPDDTQTTPQDGTGDVAPDPGALPPGDEELTP
jgi:beta-lactam-binding protein with PASTA domain